MVKIFLSWSGDLSRAIAETLRTWIPCVIQSAQPFFTPADIDKGKRWLQDISNELNASKVGIFCITPQNLNSEWILFEAGAISKSVDSSHVCPVLFDVVPGQLPSPLGQFQATLFKKEDFLKLLNTINDASSTPLAGDVLRVSFAKWWPDLEASINTIIKEQQGKSPPVKKSDGELLGEILQIVRSISVQNSSAPLVRVSSRLKLDSYTWESLPLASANAGLICNAVNVPPNRKPAVVYSDGQKWRILMMDDAGIPPVG